MNLYSLTRNKNVELATQSSKNTPNECTNKSCMVAKTSANNLNLCMCVDACVQVLAT